MRIKPKNPHIIRVRRIILGAAGTAAVLAVLLWPKDSGVLEEDSDVVEQPAVSTETVVENTAGEISWEYPEGWVDYSDLPAREDLGDESMQGLSNWRYLLVNGLSRENLMRESYYPDMIQVEHGYYFQRRAADDLAAFLAAARDEGYVVSMSRTWLSYPDQKTRFNGMASTIYDRGECSLAEAEERVAAQGYYPGADEHQTGLAVNFVDENGEAKFATPVLQWMREHCAEYGFILRYPEGKESFTGRDAEPGHFRYVGDIAAEYIMRKGITLEEFVNAYKDEEEADVVWLW